MARYGVKSVTCKQNAMKKYDIPLTALAIAVFLWLGSVIGRKFTEDKYPIHVYDTETVSRAERKVYSKTRINEFCSGDTLSSKENGALILWKPWMGEELIVGIVSDSGTIETWHQ